MFALLPGTDSLTYFRLGISDPSHGVTESLSHPIITYGLLAEGAVGSKDAGEPLAWSLGEAQSAAEVLELEHLQSHHDHSEGAGSGGESLPSLAPFLRGVLGADSDHERLLSCILLAKPGQSGRPRSMPAICPSRLPNSLPREPFVLCPPYPYATPTRASNRHLLPSPFSF